MLSLHANAHGNQRTPHCDRPAQRHTNTNARTSHSDISTFHPGSGKRDAIASSAVVHLSVSYGHRGAGTALASGNE